MDYKFDFVVIDFETANANLNSACSIGIVGVKKLEIVHERSYYIKPPTNLFSHENIKIHGITLDTVSDSPTFAELWPAISPYFRNIVIAHNSQFDLSVLHNCMQTYSLNCPNFIYLDSISISSLAESEDVGNSLAETAKYFGIENENCHDALCDARCAAQIVIESIKALYLPTLQWLAILNNINAKTFYTIKANKRMVTSKGKNAAPKISDIIADECDFDELHPLFKKNCVLTGELNSMDRQTAMQAIVNVGGVIKSGVSRKTDYVVVGTQDESLVGDDGMSTKERKAYQLIDEGCNIEILDESQFLSLLS